MDHVAEAPTAPSPPPVARTLAALAGDVRDLAGDHLELAVLEAQRASLSLAKFLCAAVVVSVLVITAWLALVAGGIVWATDQGVGWANALLVAALANVAVAAALVCWIRAHKGELLFAATLRQLRPTADIAGHGVTP
jgi:uncharacterized membrane protein YqjE